MRKAKLYNNSKGTYFRFGNSRIYLHEVMRINNDTDIIGVYTLCNVASIAIVDVNDYEETITYKLLII